MTEGLRSPAGRAVALDMLGFVVRRQPTWLHKVLVVVEWMVVEVVVEWMVVVVVEWMVVEVVVECMVVVVVEWMAVVVVKVEWTVVTLYTRWCSTRCSTSW